ncbi:LAETG motif-containing sortase-dependent surface protein [Streptomyces sp. NBC_00887]|uniref:LAETG motif-containing sortase-dependent surface protein n=1 Tax=Streptomyces sp. NBC_00887 TaxID=2975859 RepID=UPI00386B657F|nr:LPXTG cell wall anchor domain-containing protein [Streptomyces sp. NBC_00887]
MKLRRTMALAAATAVIAPVVVLSAPAAFATDTTPTPSATESVSTAPSETASAGTTESASPSATTSADADKTATTSPSASASETTSATPSATPTPTASETEDPEEPDEDGYCNPSPLKLSINGLAGKITRGSGWDTFTFNVYNKSKKTVKNVWFFAGAASDKAGDHLFTSKQVRLQALNEDTGTWEDLNEEGVSTGYVGETDAIKPGYEVDISLRIKVQATAPVGAGFSLGGGLVFGEEEDLPCFTDVAYKFQIVKAGDGDGTKPQEGGKVPVPSEKPADADAGQVTGSLAETGSSSTTPMFALAGGAAVVLGAGAMFIVRRRKNGDSAA